MPDRTYAALLGAGPWRAIRDCPGRSVWRGPKDRTLSALVGSAVPVRVFRVAAAPDDVHVVVLDDGGVISYRKPDGSFVHTLNTPEGFARKLHDLGISLEESEP